MERRSFLALPWFGRRKEINACGARFRVIRRGSTARRYLFIHGDETTARCGDVVVAAAYYLTAARITMVSGEGSGSSATTATKR